MSSWNATDIRRLASDKHVGQKAEILRAAANILEMEDAAIELRRNIRNHMEELDGWYDISPLSRDDLVDGIAAVFETKKTQQSTMAPPAGFAPAPR